MNKIETGFFFGFLMNLFLRLSLVAKTCEACHGYKITKFNYQVLHVDDPLMAVNITNGFQVELTHDCRLVTRGCIDLPAYEEFKLHYHFYKNGTFDEKNENVDGCEMLERYSDYPYCPCIIELLAGRTNCPIIEKAAACNLSCSFAVKVSPDQAKLAEGDWDAHGKYCPNNKCTEFIVNVTVSKEES